LNEGERLQRNIKWLNYYLPMQNKELNFDSIYLVDNSSSKEKLDVLKSQFKNAPIEIYERKVHLPRWKTNAYPYWYVGFAKALEYAIKNEYSKILHIDSDVYLLNKNICDYVNNANTGWIAFWCSMYNYPETTFQIINQDNFQLAHRWFTEDFLEFYPEDIAETRIPFTYVEKKFNGDRFGEKLLQQNDSMDYYGQCPVDITLKFRG
jgi:hypothetical protein